MSEIGKKNVREFAFSTILRGGMAPCGVIFHENVNFLFVAQKCQVIHAFHKTHKQNVIALTETQNLGGHY